MVASAGPSLALRSGRLEGVSPGEVQLSNDVRGALQDRLEQGGDIDDLEIVAGVVTRACSLEQLELLTEHLEKILVASDRCRDSSSLVPCHTAKTSKGGYPSSIGVVLVSAGRPRPCPRRRPRHPDRASLVSEDVTPVHASVLSPEDRGNLCGPNHIRPVKCPAPSVTRWGSLLCATGDSVVRCRRPDMRMDRVGAPSPAVNSGVSLSAAASPE